MTPEQRAARAVPADFAAQTADELRTHVATAIRDAIADERTACARIAAVMGMPRDTSERDATAQPEQVATARLAVRIAQAIEARGTARG